MTEGKIGGGKGKSGTALGVMWWGTAPDATGNSSATGRPQASCDARLVTQFNSVSLARGTYPVIMATEPPEDAIANFVSFTSTTREQAISFLKVRSTLTLSSLLAFRLELISPYY